jgi:hypothetical protein
LAQEIIAKEFSATGYFRFTLEIGWEVGSFHIVTKVLGAVTEKEEFF